MIAIVGLIIIAASFLAMLIWFLYDVYLSWRRERAWARIRESEIRRRKALGLPPGPLATDIFCRRS
jgi:hypothetical protein